MLREYLGDKLVLSAFTLVNGIAWQALFNAGARFHFHKHQFRAIAHDDVDFPGLA